MLEEHVTYVHETRITTNPVQRSTLNYGYFVSVPIFPFYFILVFKKNKPLIRALVVTYCGQLGLRATVFQSKTVFSVELSTTTTEA